MHKAEMQLLLTRALALLDEAANSGSLSARQRKRYAAFVAETRDALGGDGRGQPRTWRLARVVNPKNGRWGWVQVSATGELKPSDKKRLGASFVAEWVEVHAPSWREAQQRVAEEKYTLMERHKGRARVVEDGRPITARDATT